GAPRGGAYLEEDDVGHRQPEPPARGADRSGVAEPGGRAEHRRPEPDAEGRADPRHPSAPVAAASDHAGGSSPMEAAPGHHAPGAAPAHRARAPARPRSVHRPGGIHAGTRGPVRAAGSLAPLRRPPGRQDLAASAGYGARRVRGDVVPATRVAFAAIAAAAVVAYGPPPYSRPGSRGGRDSGAEEGPRNAGEGERPGDRRLPAVAIPIGGTGPSWIRNPRAALRPSRCGRGHARSERRPTRIGRSVPTASSLPTAPPPCTPAGSPAVASAPLNPTTRAGTSSPSGRPGRARSARPPRSRTGSTPAHRPRPSVPPRPGLVPRP